MKISFIGIGYVGLVSGVMMSHLGHEVVCFDIDKKKISMLKNKKIPIYEPGLGKYLDQYGNTNGLQFVYGYDNSLKNSDCLFITVGTPSKENGDAELRAVYKALDNTHHYINSNCVIVLKSTVPPGTCEFVQQYIYKKGLNCSVVSNPEFLREGNAIRDFLEPDRIVIGAKTENAFKVMRNIYKPLTAQGVELVETDLNTSELIKYASNTFLANKIAFINEMADLCEIIGADITTLARGIGLDRRIGESFFKAGPGFGGSCFPKDILALQKLAAKVNSDFLILDAVIEANRNRPFRMLKKISDVVGGVQKKKLAVLGLTYKAGTDDLRNSPALKLISLLKQNNAKIIAYDPEGMLNTNKYFDNLDCAHSVMLAISGVDAIIICTEWPEFESINLDKIKELAPKAAIVDLRNLLNSNKVESKGIKYYSVGKKSEK